MKNRCASLLITFFASCGGESPKEDAAVTSADSTAAENTEESAALSGNVPEDADLGGLTISLLHDQEDEMFKAEDDGDVVNSAIIARNSAVEETLNCKFVTTAHDYDVDTVIRPQILAGDTSFNLYSGAQWVLAPLVLENCFINLLDYGMDFSTDWWATAYMDESAVGNGARFLCGGDITLSMLSWQSCVFFNQQVYSDLFGDPDDMYGTVMDGKWTLDMLASMGRTVYSDLNGDGTADDGDRYSIGVHTANLTDHLAYDTGFRVTERDANNVPVIIVGSERTAEFTEKLYALFYENEGTHVFPASNDTSNITIPGKFKNNEMMFDLGWFNTTTYLRDMEGDFSLIPYPKYDEAQDSYLSLVHDTAKLYAIPLTCSAEEAEALAYVLEEMAFLAWRDVTPAYYEVALKVKYVRDSDDVALQIVDMVHDGATTDFGYIYCYALDQIGTVMRTLMGKKSADFASQWAKSEASVTAKFDELVELYQSLE